MNISATPENDPESGGHLFLLFIYLFIYLLFIYYLFIYYLFIWLIVSLKRNEYVWHITDI